MFSNRNSLASLLITVVFLVLIVIVAVFYGGSKEQKAEMEKNIFWQKTFLVLEATKTAVSSLINTDLDKKNSSSSDSGTMVEYQEEPEATETVATENKINEGFWSDLVSKIKEEWQKGETVEVKSDSATDQAKFLDWQKTATGAEIIFREKNGEEHKLPLPFKFLSQ